MYRYLNVLLLFVYSLCVFSQTYIGGVANIQETIRFTNDGKFNLTIRSTTVSDDVLGDYVKKDDLIICRVNSSLCGFFLKGDSLKYKTKDDELLVFNINGEQIKNASFKLLAQDHSIIMQLPKEVEMRVNQYLLKMHERNEFHFAGYLQHIDNKMYKYCLIITKYDYSSFFYRETNRFLNISNTIIPLAFDYDMEFGKVYPKYSDEFANRMQMRGLYSEEDFNIFFDSTGKNIK